MRVMSRFPCAVVSARMAERKRRGTLYSVPDYFPSLLVLRSTYLHVVALFLIESIVRGFNTYGFAMVEYFFDGDRGKGSFDC